MARDHARLNLAIWGDPEFRALPPAAQHLYMVLWTSPDLTYAGTHDWRPGRLAARSRGFDSSHQTTVAECLQARHFLVVDNDTEEALVRSWARFDGLLKQPRMAVSYATAYAAVASQTLRQVLAHETRKIQKEAPDLACWKDSRVAALLDHPTISAKDLPTPEDPFGDELTPWVTPGLDMGLPQTQPKVYPSGYTPPTPAPAPAPKPPVVEGGVGGDDSTTSATTRKRAAQLPDNWEPNDGHRSYADEKHLDLDGEAEQFRDHHRAKGSTMKDWDAAFRTWLRNAVKFGNQRAPQPAVTRLPYAHELEAAPPGLTDDEYFEWEAVQRRKRQA